MECDYVIFVTGIGSDSLEKTVCFYARNEAFAEYLANMLQSLSVNGPIIDGFVVKQVRWAKL